MLLKIYDATMPRLYSLTFRWTRGDHGLTEDIVQETFLRALGNWDDKGVPDNPAAWLSSVARNLIISHFRSAKLTALEEIPKELLWEEDDLTTVERIGLLGRTLQNLRNRYSRLIESFHLEGKTIKEIAHEEGISERAVEGRLRRGRKQLRKLLNLQSLEKGQKYE